MLCGSVCTILASCMAEKHGGMIVGGKAVTGMIAFRVGASEQHRSIIKAGVKHR